MVTSHQGSPRAGLTYPPDCSPQTIRSLDKGGIGIHPEEGLDPTAAVRVVFTGSDNEEEDDGDERTMLGDDASSVAASSIAAANFPAARPTTSQQRLEREIEAIKLEVSRMRRKIVPR